MNDKDFENKGLSLMDRMKKYQEYQELYNNTYIELKNVLSHPMALQNSYTVKIASPYLNRSIEHLNDPLCLNYNPDLYNQLTFEWKTKKSIGIWDQMEDSNIINYTGLGVMIKDSTRTFTTKL